MAEKLGGKVVVPKTVVPGMGFYAFCVDTEHNSFGILMRTLNEVNEMNTTYC
jgi:predicted enzyme related to lactoylglutathione lyase